MSSAFKEGAAGTADRHALLPRPRRISLRLRGKGPLWTGLMLLFLAADLMLAVAAWHAVDFFRN